MSFKCDTCTYINHFQTSISPYKPHVPHFTKIFYSRIAESICTIRPATPTTIVYTQKMSKGTMINIVSLGGRTASNHHCCRRRLVASSGAVCVHIYYTPFVRLAQTSRTEWKTIKASNRMVIECICISRSPDHVYQEYIYFGSRVRSATTSSFFLRDGNSRM